MNWALPGCWAGGLGLSTCMTQDECVQKVTAMAAGKGRDSLMFLSVRQASETPIL